VTRCTNIAAVKVAEITELIQTALDTDAAARLTGSVATVTSSCHAAVSADSASETVDMNTAKETAATLLSAVGGDESSTAASVIDPVSVPTTAVVDSGNDTACFLLSSVAVIAD